MLVKPVANSNQFDSLARIDYQKSEKHSLFGRYLQARLDQPTDADPSNLLSGSTANGSGSHGIGGAS